MMMPTLCFFIIGMVGILFGFESALRLSAGGKRGDIDTSLGQGALEFLPPVGDITGGTVAIEHAERGLADVGELVEDAGRDVNHLPRDQGLALRAKAHFANAFDDEVNFLLFLIVPRHLAALGLERDIAHAEIFRLDGSNAPGEVLRAAACRVAAAFDLSEIGDGHGWMEN